MTDEQKVFIRGIKGRGDEVIKTLEGRGAKNYQLDGADPEYLYYINHEGSISLALLDSEFGKIIMDNYRELELGQWKDGDVLISKDGDSFAIFRRYEPDFTFSSSLEVTGNVCKEYSRGLICYMGLYRHATPSEIERFHELLHMHGKGWDAEKKQLVKWRWKPKIEEAYWIVTGNNDIIQSVWAGTHVDNKYFDFGNCFRTREEAETIAEKVKKLLKGE